ncbi:hypothetical protein DNK06_12810 [Pseudomonas daroniae]|uniref:Uncharacterized protein n=1 Tax=Phytopseudomonas daroniae TaxID=2487519 RepID=A0A4Q9QLQ9_9GAMM|nr:MULTISPECIES: hypothetical protein [Pseudomonas]TBU79284.1 hypothetical protein DNK06_12810 [Pseudomonas daroniae]TBU80066.1 hypothetical protein DNK31_17665 [Pseudomonas sp. FRB 228]TBU91384.1 hypothetical protein DNJ99_10330 [Pseudomonas daroniae]
MNDHPHDLERDDEYLLRHVREHKREQPSAALDARILAAATEAAAARRPQTESAWQRLQNWLAGASGRGRWSAAFGCLAVLGLGLGLSLKTLERVPPSYDAPPAAMTRQAPAPMALHSPQEAMPSSAMAEAAEAPKIVARMAAKTAPLHNEVVEALREIADLRARGEGEEAEQRVERLQTQYPDLDIESELRRLPGP